MVVVVDFKLEEEIGGGSDEEEEDDGDGGRRKLGMLRWPEWGSPPAMGVIRDGVGGEIERWWWFNFKKKRLR